MNGCHAFPFALQHVCVLCPAGVDRTSAASPLPVHDDVDDGNGVEGGSVRGSESGTDSEETSDIGTTTSDVFGVLNHRSTFQEIASGFRSKVPNNNSQPTPATSPRRPMTPMNVDGGEGLRVADPLLGTQLLMF